MEKKYAALIPARGGSKGIPNKNIKLCGGKPLIQHTIDCALACFSPDSVFVSTDSKEISDLSAGLGAQTPFLRPTELAQDQTSMLEVLSHFLCWLERSWQRIDGLILLQPTSPLRKPETIRAVIKLAEERSADSVVTVQKVPHQYNPESLMKMEPDSVLRSLEGGPVKAGRRQDKSVLWARNGPAVLFLRPANVKSGFIYGDNLLGFECDAEESIDIDHPFDFKVADLLLRERGRV